MAISGASEMESSRAREMGNSEVSIPLSLLMLPETKLKKLDTQLMIRWTATNVELGIEPKDGIEDADELLKFVLDKVDSQKEPLWRILKFVTDFYSAEEHLSFFSTYYERRKELGNGGFGTVFKCQHKWDGKEYAIKIIPFADEEEKDTLRELRALTLRHMNVVQYYKAWVEDGVPPFAVVDREPDEPIATKSLYIVMELCKSTLALEIENEKNFTSDDILRILEDSLRGLVYLHCKDLIHADISLGNVFLDIEGVIKLGDFGLVVDDDGMPRFIGGNEKYHPPELKNIEPGNDGYKQGILTKAVDIYALAVVTVELVFSSVTAMEFSSIINGISKNGMFPSQNKIPSRLTRILTEMLDVNPSNRPSAEKVLADIQYLE